MNRDVLDEKDILELFNYIEKDDKEDERVDLKMNDLRKKKLRKNLLKQVKGKNSIKNFRYKVAAVAAIVILSIGLAMPAVAKSVSVLKSMIQTLSNKDDDNGVYERYSKIINKSVTDKGITFTINEVLCDEKTLMISYTIKSEGDIKKIVRSTKEVYENSRVDNAAFFISNYLTIDGIKPFGGGPLSGNDKFLDEHTYVNSEAIYFYNEKLPDVFNVNLDIKNIFKIEGNWNFKFSVPKKEVLKDSKIFKPNTTVKFPDATVNIEKVAFTPINTYVDIVGKYTKEEYKDRIKRKEAFNMKREEGVIVYNQWAIFDDNGYEIEPAHVASGDSPPKDFYSEYVLSSVKKVPKYLTITPYRELPWKGGQRKKVDKDINGEYPIELSQGEIGKLIIRDIKIEKDKTIVKVTIEGKLPFYQAMFLHIVDENGEWISRKNNKVITSIDESTVNGYICEFEPLDRNKKYKIMAEVLDGELEIRDDLKVRVDLSNK